MSSTPLRDAFARATATATVDTPHHRSCSLPRNTYCIKPSPFRPHVLAADRLDKWLTPFAVQFRTARANSTSLHSSLHHRQMSLSSLEPLTRKNYGAGLLRFTQFCDREHVPEDDRMPASDALLAEFTAYWCGKVSHSTMETWPAGVAFWHTVNGAPTLAGRQVKAITRKASKIQPPPRQKRSPVTVEHLNCLRTHLDLTDSFDASVFAVATIAFWSCRRLGKLLIPSPTTFDPTRHISRSALPGLHRSSPTTTYYTLHLPWTKTTLTRGLIVSVTSINEPSCPAIALAHHLSRSTALPSNAPLFGYQSISPDGWSPMTRDWFLRRCNEVWSSHHLETLTGHSFRIGGTTELLLRGTPPDVVALQGSWKSRAFLEYWRRIEEILPTFISKYNSPSSIKSITTTMTAFQELATRSVFSTPSYFLSTCSRLLPTELYTYLLLSVCTHSQPLTRMATNPTVFVSTSAYLVSY